MARSAFRAMIIGALACAVPAGPAAAQDWPTKPVRILVGFGAGGGTDIVARIVAQPLSELLGQPVVVENKPGAGGTTAADAVAKSAKDGYTALMMSNAQAVSDVMYKSLPFDSVKDFQSVSLVATAGLLVVAKKDFPANNIAELIAYAKANPGKLNFASIGVGASQHFSGELLRQLAGIDMKHIPYRGTPAAIAAVRAGEVELLFELVSTVIGQVRAGDLKALGVTSPERWPALPDVPTIREQGVPGYEVVSWYGLAFPAGVPKPVVDKLNKALREVLARDTVKKQIADAGVQVGSSSPEEMTRLLESEIVKWRGVRDKAGIQAQ
jgi:tripartite-type tricarboxylate transporter receptor subunit TctC